MGEIDNFYNVVYTGIIASVVVVYWKLDETYNILYPLRHTQNVIFVTHLTVTL